ncbi:CDP-diacylglycerol--serine O-phosphatidyltransferase [Atractiella rhizophila]|nr:CDP-diacylglycerol--serine O-phosphatidyltransferase [Atractiella rhizophila]
MPGTAAEYTATIPSEGPISAKPAPSPPTEAIAEALASRRESVNIAQGKQDILGALKGHGSSDSVAVEEEKTEKQKSEQQHLKQFVDDDRHFSLVRNFRVADLVTLMNGVCGSMSVFSSANYLLSNDKSHLWASLFFPLGGLIFDFLDGKVARWRNESSMLGQELDSLADSLSFGVAPALVGFTMGLRTPLDVSILTMFICCGIARLARFNATVASLPKDASGKSKYFEGLPIPTSLVVIGLWAICLRRGEYLGEKGLPFGIWAGLYNTTGLEVHWFSAVYGAWAAAMVSKTLKIPKP